MQKQLQISYRHYSSLEELPDDDKILVEAAQMATRKAYAPYSNFKVGAAALLESGAIISAANSESEVFPSGMCAERVLLYNYQSNHSDDKIVAFAIASDPSTHECYPCGGCRQTLLDVENRQQSPIRIIMSGGYTATVVDSAQVLLPFTFKL